MDDLVKAALKKWPNVPDCYGWLALDARGEWYMRDDRIQAAGPFPQVKGSRIDHDKLRQFIERNVAHDERGCWFFQNGPQRVYLALEAAPWVWRVQSTSAGSRVQASRGGEAEVETAWVDEQGRLFLDTSLGFGIVHSMDMLAAADAVEQGRWLPQAMAFQDMPTQFGYVLNPAGHQQNGR